MKSRRTKLILIIAPVLVLIISACISPSFRFRIGLYWESFRPALHLFGPGRCSINSFDDNVNTAELARFYKIGCDRLEYLRSGQDHRTYRWADQEGYPSISSVVQYPNGYVAVTAYEGNDSCGISIDVGPGAFPPTDNPRHYLHLREVPKNEDPGFLKGIP